MRIRSLICLALTLLLIAALPCQTVRGQTASAPNGLVSCSYLLPQSKVARAEYLYDDDAQTRLTLDKGESVTLQFDDATAASGIYAEWYTLPTAFTLDCLDAEGELLSSRIVKDADRLWYCASDGAAALRLSASDGALSIGTLVACDASFSPRFSTAEGEAELLILLAAPGDETLLLGGFAAQYAGENGLTIQFVYLCNDGDYNVYQCLDALHALGVDRCPVFLGAAASARNDSGLLKKMGGRSRVLERLTKLLRSVKPYIVIAPGDETDVAAALCASLLKEATEAAADPARYSDTTAHSVQKLYLARSDGALTLNWTDPLLCFEGQSAAAVAAASYAQYTDEQVFHRTIPTALSLDLLYSTVGKDSGTSILEHLPAEALTQHTEPTAAPTAEPTVSPMPTETPEPSKPPVSAEAEVTPDQTMPPPAATVTATASLGAPIVRTLPWWLPASIGLLAALITLAILAAKKKRSSLLLLLALVLLLTGVVCSLLLLRGSLGGGAAAVNAEQDVTLSESPIPTEKPAPTETPTPADTPAPTETPTPTDTPEPTATPDPSAVYFRQEGEPAEKIEMDFENGRWSYVSNDLSIYIERVSTQLEEEAPLIYYVADIYMRNYSSFRSGLRTATRPWKYTRFEKAVLGITGDNLTEAEKEQKGCLIRNGKLYCDYNKADTLVIESDLRLSVLTPDAFEATDLLDRGVRDTYSFGPILVSDGKLNAAANEHRVGHPNPRCGLGMVEAGHWIAIVTDGRQAGYSMSIDLITFAQLFLDRGCALAYNLDGGSSAAMVFMGEILNEHEGKGTSDVMRPWTDALLWGYSEQLPDPETPTVHDGYRH